jgi:hypothetical protein
LSKNGKNKGKYKAIVDDDVFNEVNKYKWYYNKGYARRTDRSTSKLRIIQLHRYVWELKYGKIPKGLFVDHIDRNPLNNQISNLRLVTHAENGYNINKRKNNTSGYIGISKNICKRKRKDGSIYIKNYWQCQWQDNLGKKRAKAFPDTNVGKIRAAHYYDLMVTQIRRNYTGEVNFQSLEEYQHALKKAILEDIKSN